VQFTLAKLCHYFGDLLLGLGLHLPRPDFMCVAVRWPLTGNLGLPTATMMVTGTPFLGGAFDGALGLPYIIIFP
jgi:hypothetical protein